MFCDVPVCRWFFLNFPSIWPFNSGYRTTSCERKQIERGGVNEIDLTTQRIFSIEYFRIFTITRARTHTIRRLIMSLFKFHGMLAIFDTLFCSSFAIQYSMENTQHTVSNHHHHFTRGAGFPFSSRHFFY